MKREWIKFDYPPRCNEKIKKKNLYAKKDESVIID